MSDYAARIELFDTTGSLDVYFEGTNAGATYTSSQYPVTITFTDACRTATINSQQIDFDGLGTNLDAWVVRWDTDTTATFSLTAFTDSVDGAITDSVDDSASATYSTGICGTKTFALDSSSPAYLSSSGSDPIVFSYDQSLATTDDILTVVTVA